MSGEAQSCQLSELLSCFLVVITRFQRIGQLVTCGSSNQVRRFDLASGCGFIVKLLHCSCLSAISGVAGAPQCKEWVSSFLRLGLLFSAVVHLLSGEG